MTPAMIRALLAWYERNKRALPWRDRVPPSAYHTWVSEIMLQQTRAEAVKPYYERFLAALPTVEALAGADDDRLLKLWEGLGYYSRARNLKKAAQAVVREHGGVIPSDPAALLKLPGVGLYTAGAVASIACGVPVPAVDGNVLRVCARLAADPADIALDQTKRGVAARLLRAMPRDCPGAFNQALMELGACVCLPNGSPGCGRCPLAEYCLAHAQGREADFPVKSPKKPRRVEERRLLILRCGDKLALRRRPPKGLLAGLWELPEAFGLPEGLVLSREPAGQAVHVFTHIEWRMAAERVLLRAPLPGEGLAWVTQAQLERDYALPSAFAGFRGEMF
ncbi:MAG: A/G-specific adenine glycosylase [Oscillospiraceae bacterium]|jgi:A/G-specific adenine glycosylase|nr:A/G-specific adenine glycosylase [Oscillospiraceae bacterium]